MIKFNRNDTDKARAAVRSLCKAKASNTTYNTPEVNAALVEMFHGKCYICENKRASSFQIEHLQPHKGNIDLKYDWGNLFWSCAHCNNLKNARYEPILDCSQVDVDLKVAFRKKGYFGTDETYEFVALENSIEVKNTVELLYASYYGNTPQKKLEAANIRRALRRSLSDFKNMIREYEEAEEYDKEDLRYLIRAEVSTGSSFTAFKRWLLWDHRDRYGEVLQFCGLSESNCG